MKAEMEWAELGNDNLRVAELLLTQREWRSCVSRSYYSAVATSHAILLRVGMTPPERGNWSNPELSAVLFHALRAVSPRDGRWISTAKIHRVELADCWSSRLLADYRPLAVVERRAAFECVKCARRLHRRLESLS